MSSAFSQTQTTKHKASFYRSGNIMVRYFLLQKRPFSSLPLSLCVLWDERYGSPETERGLSSPLRCHIIGKLSNWYLCCLAEQVCWCILVPAR